MQMLIPAAVAEILTGTLDDQVRDLGFLIRKGISNNDRDAQGNARILLEAIFCKASGAIQQ